jgi:Myb-like DNA-binding domain
MADPRLEKRTTIQYKDKTLGWKKGMFSALEQDNLKQAVEAWISEQPFGREEALEKLRWAKDFKMHGVWSNIAHKSQLIHRNVDSLRKAAIRFFVKEKPNDSWTVEEKEEFVKLQGIYGINSWKAIAKELHRSVEETQRMGKRLASKRVPVNKDAFKQKFLIGNEGDSYSQAVCTIFAAIRDVYGGQQSTKIPLFDISWPVVLTHMSLPLDFRNKINDIFYSACKRVAKSIDEELTTKAERAMMYSLYLLVTGKSTSEEDKMQIIVEDIESIPWKNVAPFWTSGISRQHATVLLQKHKKSEDFYEMVIDCKKALRLVEEDLPGATEYEREFQAKLKAIADKSDHGTPLLALTNSL